MGRPSRTSPTLIACAAALVLVALAGCSSTSPAAESQTNAPGDVASTAAPMSTSSAPSNPGASAPVTDPPTPEAGYANWPPAPAGASAIKLTTPCDSGTLTVTAHPDGKGVAMSATLKNPAHNRGWAGGIAVSPFANDAGDPDQPKLTLTNGELTLSATNLTGPHAVHDPKLNYAWPQRAAADLIQFKAHSECAANVYLNASRATVVAIPLEVTIQRSTGAIKVLAGPLAGRGPWQITATATSPEGTQHQTRTVTASAGATIGGPFSLTTRFTGFTHLHDFTTLTITCTKTDGTHPAWFTLTRTP